MHRVVARLRGGDGAIHAAPGHDAWRRAEAALEDLVPADQPAAVRAQEAADALR